MDSDRIKGAAKEFGGKIEEAVGHAVGDESTRASGVGRQIEGKGQNLCGQAKDNLRDVGDRAERALRETGDFAEQAFDEGSRYVKSATSDFARQVSNQPLLSLIGAAAIGFVAGIFVVRK